MTRKRVTNCLRHRTFQFTGAIISYLSGIVNDFERKIEGFCLFFDAASPPGKNAAVSVGLYLA